MRLTNAIDKILRKLGEILVAISSTALVIIVLVTVVDTGMRYLLNRPIAGSNEIVEILLSLMIMSALPICTVNRAHVRVDLLDKCLGKWGCKVADLFTGCIAITVLGLLSERSWRKAADALEFRDATIFLEFPLWIIYAVICISFAIVALILIVQTSTSALGGAFDDRF